MQVTCIIFILGISEIFGKEASVITGNRSAPENGTADGFNLSCAHLHLLQLTGQEGRGSWQQGASLGLARKGGDLHFSVWVGLFVFMESATGILDQIMFQLPSR